MVAVLVYLAVVLGAGGGSGGDGGGRGTIVFKMQLTSSA